MAERGNQTIKITKGINLDVARELIKDQATFLKNCVVDFNDAAGLTGQSSNLGNITPVISNASTFDISLGDWNICIGSKYDRRINTMFWFVYTPIGNSLYSSTAGWILQYDGNSNQFAIVDINTNYNFDPHFLITSIDVVLIDAKDSLGNPTQNVLLYWTDGNQLGGNPPRKINVITALAGGYGALQFLATSYQYFDAAKYPPYLRPTFGSAIANPDTSFVQNFIAQKQFQFRYRFQYDDGEITKWSPISTFYYSLNNTLNFIELLMSAGSSLVINVELAYRIGNFGDWRSYDTIQRSQIILNTTYPYNNTTNIFTYKFYNNRQYIVLDQNDTNLLFDIIPQKAQAECFVQGNLMTYWNILEGYDNLSLTLQATPTVDITYSDYLPLTLTLTGSIFFTWTGAPTGADLFVLAVKKTSYITGIATTLVPQTTITFGDASPKSLTAVPITDIGFGDIVWLEILGVVFAAGVGAQIQLSSTFTGTYTNISSPLPAGTGNFIVNRVSTSQTVVAADHIKFNNVVSDPNVTWSTVTFQDTVPNYALAFAQLHQGGAAGKYSFGFVMYDEVNRSSFVQTSPSQQITIQSIQSAKKFQLQSIVYNWHGIVLPNWVKNVAVVRTRNLIIDRELEKGYIDTALAAVAFYQPNNTIGVPGTNPIKSVQFTLADLIAFNTANLFKTTTDYIFTEGDRIVIIANGNGTLYDPTVAVLDFPLSSDDSITFRFSYVPALAGLVNGAWVEIYTPAKENQTNQYFEISSLIPTQTIGGVTTVTVATTTLKTFDTFPVFWNTTYFPMTGIATQPIEHHSIYLTDIVPSNGEDIGRLNVVSPTAKQLWKPTLSRYSYVYIPTSFINGLSSFDEPRMKLYDRSYGGFVQAYCKGTDMFLLCIDYHFRITLNKQQVTYADGNTSLITVNNLLSDPIEIGGIDSGCQNSESFVAWGNYLYWVDIKRSIVAQCDWSETKDIAREGLIKSYIEAKTKYIFRYNLNEHITETCFWQSLLVSILTTYTFRFLYNGTYVQGSPASQIDTIQQLCTYINTLGLPDVFYVVHGEDLICVTNPTYNYGTMYIIGGMTGLEAATSFKTCNNDFWIIPAGYNPKINQYVLTFFNTNSKDHYAYNIGTTFTTGAVTVSIVKDSIVTSGTFTITDIQSIANALTTLVANIDTFTVIQNNTVIYVIDSSLSVYGDVVVGANTYTASTTQRYIYTNDEYQIDITRPETLAWSIYGQFWSSFLGFCGEYFGVVDAELYGLSMITFKQGAPFMHDLSTTQNYNRFFGVQTNQIIKLVCNESPVTEKRFTAIMIDSKDKTSAISAVKYNGYAITTSDNLQSNLPQQAFVFKENMLYAAFMRSTSYNRTLQSGMALRGTFLEITLVRDASESVIGTYSEFAKCVIFFFTSEKSVK